MNRCVLPGSLVEPCHAQLSTPNLISHHYGLVASCAEDDDFTKTLCMVINMDLDEDDIVLLGETEARRSLFG